jgi:DNA processing protein
VIVSGLALGIDTQAHIGALGARGRTLAVLGSGVLRVYPEHNLNLAEAILKQGALLSEIAPNAPPSPATLVARNRIISGLCDRLIVVETTVDGGAMYAARRAVEQGREVYTLDLGASGNRALIAEGARPLSLDLAEVSRWG